MQHAVADLEVAVREERVKVADLEALREAGAAALELEADLGADGIVEHRRERVEVGHYAAADADQDVADGDAAVCRRPRLDLRDDQHAGARREGLACPCLGRGLQPQPAQLVVGRVLEHGLQRAARDGLAGTNQVQGPNHAIQRQVEAGLRAARAARIQRHDATVDVDDGRAGRPARGPGGGLDVEGVEVVVLPHPVVRRLAVEARERAGQDRQLLARVVADDTDLGAHLGAPGIERQLRRLDETQLRRVVAVQAEIVHRVAVDGLQLHFLAVQEHRLGGDRPRRHDMPVGQDQAPLRIHDESRRLCRGIPLRVEGPGRVDLDGDHAGRDALQRGRPAIGPVLRGLNRACQQGPGRQQYQRPFTHRRRVRNRRPRGSARRIRRVRGGDAACRAARS